MKTILSIGTVMLVCSLGVMAGEAAKPGVWTQDINVAKATAKEKGLPILLNFTGSDWCSWCKLMDKNVFSNREWQEYASGKMMMVAIDFPRNKSLVPKEYVKRNEELKRTFGVNCYPTYILLESDGETELGRLESGSDKTPVSFSKEVDHLLLLSQAGIAAYLETLTPQEKDTYKGILKDIENTNKELRETKQIRMQLNKKIMTLNTSIDELKWKTAEFRAGKAGPERLNEYKTVKVELATARKTLQDWMANPPSPTPETRAKHTEMLSAISRLETKLASF